MADRQMTPQEVALQQALMQELTARGMAPTLGPPESLRAPTIGPKPEPSWARKLLEMTTGYPADDDRELGPIETVMTAASMVPGVGAGVRAGKKAVGKVAAEAVAPAVHVATAPAGGWTKHYGVKAAAKVADARKALAEGTLGGKQITPAQLREILQTVNPYHAHIVTEGLPLPPAQGDIARMLSSANPWTMGPETTGRITGLHDIGSALPMQSNWGNARDPEWLNAFADDTDAANLYASMFSSTSPSTMVPKNTKEATAVWDAHLGTPYRPFSDKRLRDLGVGNTASKTDNINRAIWQHEPIKGPKVSRFDDYMLGRDIVPVPDMHYLRGIGSKEDSVASVLPEIRRIVQDAEGIPIGAKGGLKERDYVSRLSGAVADKLQAIDPEQSMGPLFGTFWEGSRAWQGLKQQGGPIDILRARGLMERGAMLDRKKLRKALESDKPWTASMLGLLAMLGLSPEDEAPER